jgi:hypothetical protein
LLIDRCVGELQQHIGEADLVERAPATEMLATQQADELDDTGMSHALRVSGANIAGKQHLVGWSEAWHSHRGPPRRQRTNRRGKLAITVVERSEREIGKRFAVAPETVCAANSDPDKGNRRKMLEISLGSIFAIRE